MQCTLATIHCHAHVQCLKHSLVHTICPCHMINGSGFLFPSSLVPSKYHALIHEHLRILATPQHVRLDATTTNEKIPHFAEVLMSIRSRRTRKAVVFRLKRISLQSANDATLTALLTKAEWKT